MQQLSFMLPEIDRTETKKVVEKALESYKVYLLMDPEELQPKVTSSLKLVPAAPSNQFHSTTEEVAVKKIDMERKRKEYINRIRKAVNRLNYYERSIVLKRYLNSDDVYDYEVYNELGFSERKYYRVKSRAFYKLAFILRIEVYKEDGENK
ncbi:putative phage-related protein [Lentibacillus sp. JNUCC-1]|uniref:ArpU family phage packaging/lysis transcriptional regulator n=1 Tax=Lentibacillus sp. JNUCC-1 TaxID=2654513 RepID=UPI0012E8323A|nr:ArpU family phage packaging/lysis transcriptional regulator [Lentibacillus sp. JNUCC-1]MUV39459.1 putative phage-related protein [Lentibacillus sp. JNUCC-1]